MLDIVNNEIKLRPKISIDDIATSHCVSPEQLQAQPHAVAEEGGNRHPRTVARLVIVRFTNVRVRNIVYKGCTKLKDHNASATNLIYINEDLTQTQARLLKDCQRLKKESHVNDYWSWNGNIFKTRPIRWYQCVHMVTSVFIIDIGHYLNVSADPMTCGNDWALNHHLSY